MELEVISRVARGNHYRGHPLRYAMVEARHLVGKLEPTCYVCGPTPFVEIAAGFLSACGNRSDKIKTERFGPTGAKK
jgi:ferredoxin-NADP reductase